MTLDAYFEKMLRHLMQTKLSTIDDELEKGQYRAVKCVQCWDQY